MSDKPLHVRVAEALGTLHVLGAKEQYVDDIPRPRWNRTCTIHGDGPYDLSIDYDGKIIAPNYDTDWAATGPLIEKYKINLGVEESGWEAFNYPGGLSLESTDYHPTPLVAVCNLILELGKVGKL